MLFKIIIFVSIFFIVKNLIIKIFSKKFLDKMNMKDFI